MRTEALIAQEISDLVFGECDAYIELFYGPFGVYSHIMHRISVRQYIAVCFSRGLYRQFSDARNSVIYCDMLYLRRRKQNFNQDEFYEWVNKMVERPNLIFIYERADALPVPWEIVATFKNNEKLFLVSFSEIIDNLKEQ